MPVASPRYLHAQWVPMRPRSVYSVFSPLWRSQPVWWRLGRVPLEVLAGRESGRGHVSRFTAHGCRHVLLLFPVPLSLPETPPPGTHHTVVCSKSGSFHSFILYQDSDWYEFGGLGFVLLLPAKGISVKLIRKPLNCINFVVQVYQRYQ